MQTIPILTYTLDYSQGFFHIRKEKCFRNLCFFHIFLSIVDVDLKKEKMFQKQKFGKFRACKYSVGSIFAVLIALI